MGAPKPVETAEKPPNPNLESEQYTERDAFNADIIFQILGRFGWFQIKYLVTIGYSLMFTTAGILIYTFVAGVPKHRCFVDGCDDPVNPEYYADWLNDTALLDLEMNPRAPYWRCSYRDFEIIPNTSTPSCVANYTANVACDSWVFDDSVFTKTIVIDYNLVCNESWKITFGSFITMLGVLVGAFLLGPLPDLIGRRISVVILAVWFSGFAIASCFMPSFDAFVALRFISAMGGIALMQSLIIWGLEAMTPSMRIPFICTIYCFQGLGNLISGLLAYFIRNWVTLQLCIFVPLGSLIFSYFILPESTRWLTVKKKYAEAKEIYENAAKLNKKNIPPILLAIPSDDEKKTIEEDGAAPVLANHDSNPLSSALQVLKTRCLLVRLLILCSTWLAQFLCYYGLSYAASNLSSNIHLNYILVMLVEIPAYIAGMFALNILGRRLILNLTLILGGAFCLVAGLVSKEYTTVIIVFSLMGKFCTAMLTVANNAFAFELFPTVSRGITIALCSTSGKIGAVIAPYIAAMGATNRSLPYVIFGAVALAVGVLTLLLPETKGKPVPSTVKEAIDLEETRIDICKFFRQRGACCGTKSNSTDTNSDTSS